VEATLHRNREVSGLTCGWTPGPEHPGKSPLQVPHLENCRHAGGPPIAQRSPNSTLLWPPVEFPDAKRKEAPALELPQCSTRYEQPFYLLKPEARLARALVDLDPRQAPTPKLISRHGALHRTDAPEPQSGTVPRIACPFPKMCEPFHTSSAIYMRGGDPVGTQPLEAQQLTRRRRRQPSMIQIPQHLEPRQLPIAHHTNCHP
jgi:hypothetical protein